MRKRLHPWICGVCAVMGAAVGVFGRGAVGRATGVPSAFTRAFAFPASAANGLVGDLVQPTETQSPLHFAGGNVAIGELPIPMPLRPGRRGQARDLQKFTRVEDSGPHARLLLTGVADAGGKPVTNSGNQLVVDAVVSPSSAAVSMPPYVIPFDITDGTAFVDAPLPIVRQTGEGVSIQVLAVSVVDPDGQPFGVLGLLLAPARSTPTPRFTPTPGDTPLPDGACFTGAECTGPSFPSSQTKCCRVFGRASTVLSSSSWCPPDQFDATTGQCAAGACRACVPPPAAECDDRAECGGPCSVSCGDNRIAVGTCQKGAGCACAARCGEPPTPTPRPCADAATCGGPCAAACPDGTVIAGKCVVDPGDGCTCSASCSAPTPCGAGQCFDTLTGRCTGQACGRGSDCPLPNQFCDLSGRHCACGPPPPPHGRLCCQCGTGGAQCFDMQFAEVQPICPPGCQSFVGQTCDPNSGSCGPATPCASDQDCDDGNGCTIDRCTPDGCTHDCVCVGPAGCGPGPGAHPQPPHDLR